MAIMIPCCFFSALIVFFWRFAHNLASLLALAITYGLISGGMVSLPAGIVANLTNHPSEYGTRIGMSFTIAAFGALLGNPIAAAARRKSLNDSHGSGNGNGIISNVSSSDVQRQVQLEFQGVWWFAGSAMLFATLLITLARVLKLGWSWREKL